MTVIASCGRDSLGTFTYAVTPLMIRTAKAEKIILARRAAKAIILFISASPAPGH
jgi:hypothetical protein